VFAHYIEEKRLIMGGAGDHHCLSCETELECPSQIELSSYVREHWWNLAKAWVEDFSAGKVGNERLLMSPILSIVGCSHLSAQETDSSATSFMKFLQQEKITPWWEGGKKVTCFPLTSIIHVARIQYLCSAPSRCN
jgi:hypothetical protein